MTKDLNEPLTMELTLTMDEWADIGSLLMTISEDVAHEAFILSDPEFRARANLLSHRASALADTIKTKWHEANDGN